MDGIDLDKLAKVLALADSNQAGEAAGAFKAATRMLQSRGQTWGDFSRWMTQRSGGRSAHEAMTEVKRRKERRSKAERELDKARRDLDNAEWELEALQRTHRKLLGELVAVKAERDRVSVDHYRELAELRTERDRIATLLKPAQRRAEVVRLLRQGDLTDREIARRVGVSPQTVGNVRRAGLVTRKD